MFWEIFNRLCNEHNIKPNTVAKEIGIPSGSVTDWKKGRIPRDGTLIKIADYFNVSMDYLLGKEKREIHPRITEDTITFPVIGSIAAGYDHIEEEDYNGDTVEIPASYLHGLPRTDFFVLKVEGNSMYPLYIEGDRVLVRKCETLDRSGQIGAILYEGEYVTLKKVEYVNGEDWVKLIPINPEYPPKTIKGVDLEQCRVLGMPVLLIREIRQ